jgi:hypothetical protein
VVAISSPNGGRSHARSTRSLTAPSIIRPLLSTTSVWSEPTWSATALAKGASGVARTSSGMNVCS